MERKRCHEPILPKKSKFSTCFHFVEVLFEQLQIEASESSSNMSDSMTSMSISTCATPPLLGPGEIIKPSGKFSKPTRIPGKNYCKDEVVIRNADSGKGINLLVNCTIYFY